MHRLAVSLIAFAAVAACDRTKSPDTSETKPAQGSQPTTPAPGSQASAPQQPPAADGSVEIFIDDKSVAKVKKADLEKWPQLTTLLPEDARRLGTWTTLSIVGKKKEDLTRPSAAYPDKVAALYLRDGVPTFGMFDAVELAKKGEPALRADAVTQIRLVLSKEGRGGDHQGGAGAVEDPAKLVISVKQGKEEKKILGKQLLDLPREPQPGNADIKGWRLTHILELAGVKKYDKLVLGDASGLTLVLERRDFDDKDVVPFVKLNKSNSLRVRVIKKVGDGWQNGQDLRALSSIIVE